MANRYWVGGTDNWDGNAGTKWSTVSGGAGGASEPGFSDDVFLDANSGSGTVTIATGNGGAKSITCTGFTGTLAGSAAITVAGSFIINTTMGYSYSGALTITGTGTLSAQNRILGALTINAPNSIVSLGSDITVGSSFTTLTLTSGTLSVGNYNLSAGQFSSSNSNVRTLSLDSGTLTLDWYAASGGVLNIATKTNLTIDAGTSTLRFVGGTGGSSVTIDLGTFVWYKILLQVSTTPFIFNGSPYIDELATDWQGTVFRNITFTGGTTTTIRRLNVNGTAAGSTSLIGTVSTTYISVLERPVDMQFVNANGLIALCAPLYLGASATVTSCTNIFASSYVAPFTHYWVGGSGNWTDVARWASSSGGAGGLAAPYGDEDVVFDSASSASAYNVTIVATSLCKNITINPPASGNATISWSGNTASSNLYVYGSFYASPTNVKTASNGLFNIYFSTGSTATIDYGGLGTGGPVGAAGNFIFSGFGTWNLASNLNVSNFANNFISHTSGTLNTNNYNITWGTNLGFSSTGNTKRQLNLGSSVWQTSNSFVLSGTYLTFNAGTSTVAAPSIDGGGRAFYAVGNAGLASVTLSNTNNDTYQYIVGSGPSTAGIYSIVIAANNLSVLGFQTNNTAGNRRVLFCSNTTGMAKTINVTGTSSITDADFRDIIVQGASAPISGTRIGDWQGCQGITFSIPKTVYWATAAGGNWSGNNWAPSAGGTVNTDNFPLAQDIATFVNTGLNTSATVTMDNVLTSTGTIDMSGRTNAMTLSAAVAYTIYGDWKNGSGTTLSGAVTHVFSKRGTQTITSAGKTFAGSLTIDSFGGTVELADALNIGTNTLTVTNGTFDAKTYNVTMGVLSSNNTNVRSIKLGSGTIALSNATPIVFTDKTNLTLDAGTSQVNLSASTAITFNGNGLTFYNVSLTGTGSVTQTFNGVNTFNNLTFTAPAATGFMQVVFAANQTILGTLTCAGATAIRRLFVRSDTRGTGRTLSVGTLAATDCDFRDIAITGAAAGSTPTRAGNCGGNSGITFSAKTVYWNLAGTQNWSATGWAPTSGGTVDINQFPLAQDTAVFNDSGSAGTITFDVAWNVGSVDMSARTAAMTLSTSTLSIPIHGDWLLGTGVTSASTTGALLFYKRGTQTITSNGVTTNCPVTIDSLTGTTQLGSAFLLGSGRTLTVTSGIFDAVTYDVTAPLVSISGSTSRTVKMGSGLWTLSGTGTVWDATTITNLNFYKNTANITLSDTSTTARTFAGGGLSYNVFTIGGTTGTSTTSITGNNQFSELASTKTVAHTIDLGATTQTFRKWTVTGTVGNVVTISGSTATHILAGPATSGINYLAMGSVGFAATSPGEFYAGANTTGTAAAPVFRTATPAATTRYWVGGTGNWSSTTKWSTGSGGASGASVPTSLDTVIFDNLSNATAYTATIDATSRCGSLTINGPASGNVTVAGTAALIAHSNVTLASTGITRTYTGPITLSGSSTAKTLTTNGNVLASTVTLNGDLCDWSLGSALDIGTNAVTVTNGILKTSTFGLTADSIVSDNANSRTIDLGSSTITLSGATPINFGTTETNRDPLTVTGGTSQINATAATATFTGNQKSFNNVAFTSVTRATTTMNGANTFNNLSFTGRTTFGIATVSFTANQTVSGTLTFAAGTNATMRNFVISDVAGTSRTLTCAAVSLTDADFRDITIAGAAAPATGTRIGNCAGNSGITFTAAANKYWNLLGGGNWNDVAWATSSGGAVGVNNFPLPQDTCIFDANGLDTNGAILVNGNWNIGSIDMSARTAKTIRFSTSANSPIIYGNWTNGTGTILTGTGTLTFSGRGAQSITSAGKSFGHLMVIDSIGGTVTLQDAMILTQNIASVLTLNNGTIDASSYSVTLSGAVSSFNSSNSNTRTIAVGSGTWVIAGSGGWNTGTATNLTVTSVGNGTISLTSSSAKTFAGGGAVYSGVALDQGGAGALTVTGNNTFRTITNSYGATGAATISLGTTSTTLTSPFAASGSSGKQLTLTGTSISSHANLIYSGGGTAANVNFITILGIRSYPITGVWNAGANSLNTGSLGWTFAAAATAATYNFFFFFN